MFTRLKLAVFKLVQGAWGGGGCSYVCLEAAGKPALGPALVAAWRNIAPKRLPSNWTGN